MGLQWIRSGKFKLFDYGSRRANRSAYGESAPPDIAAAYKLINVPVDIVAGKADGVIAPQNVRQHARCLKEAGCQVCLLSPQCSAASAHKPVNGTCSSAHASMAMWLCAAPATLCQPRHAVWSGHACHGTCCWLLCPAMTSHGLNSRRPLPDSVRACVRSA